MPLVLKSQEKVKVMEFESGSSIILRFGQDRETGREGSSPKVQVCAGVYGKDKGGKVNWCGMDGKGMDMDMNIGYWLWR